MGGLEEYELVDFGEGRRLERFGPWCLDRPCPAVRRVPRGDASAWNAADARFDRTGRGAGRWTLLRPVPQRWHLRSGPLVFELKRTDFGHVGFFAEQAAHWEWLLGELSAGGRLRVLNLFGYTGGSTLAAAAAGAEVTHVDSAANVVAWAQRNAQLSGLSAAAIRWVVEDVRKFVRAELRAGRRYDAVILDPPSFGRGPHGQVWRLADHLPWLLRCCAQLLSERPRFVLLTCHTRGYPVRRLRRMLAKALRWLGEAKLVAEPMAIPSAAGHRLPSGVAVRWVAADRCWPAEIPGGRPQRP